MNTKTISRMALVALSLVVTGQVAAQNLRPEKTLYVMPRIGFSTYVGDRDAYPWDFGYWKEDGKLPYNASLELGYQFTPAVALGLSYSVGDFPTIWGEGNSDGNFTRRHVGAAFLRFTVGADTRRFAPYLEIGAMGNNGEGDFTTTTTPQDKYRFAYGPMAGVGFDVVLNDRTSLFLGGQLGAQFPDEATDASDSPTDAPALQVDKAGSFDWMGSWGVGLKLNFRSAFTAVDVIAIDGPATLETNQTGTFTATTNDGEASTPVEYRWDFGDGSTADGLVATHAYTRAGTYTVTFTASNSGSMDSSTMSVTVNNPPVPAAVVSATSTPMGTACLNQPVSFTANARGDAPVTYSWNFGDGSTGTGMNASHTYTTAGTYTVTLNVSNASGSDTRTMTVTVNDCAVSDNCANITELNSAYFERNSSTLTEQGRMQLMENVEVLRNCTALNVRLEGFAAPGERNPQQLSEDRARAVMQFYTDNGIAASQLTMMGMGAVGGTTSKKDDTSQFRRVDSIPVR